MTISRSNNLSISLINRIEFMGEDLQLEDCEYNWEKHPENPFTKEEMEYYLEFYKKNLI